jgi:hypothetical protein
METYSIDIEENDIKIRRSKHRKGRVTLSKPVYRKTKKGFIRVGTRQGTKGIWL